MSQQFTQESSLGSTREKLFLGGGNTVGNTVENMKVANIILLKRKISLNVFFCVFIVNKFNTIILVEPTFTISVYVRLWISHIDYETVRNEYH